MGVVGGGKCDPNPACRRGPKLRAVTKERWLPPVHPRAPSMSHYPETPQSPGRHKSTANGTHGGRRGVGKLGQQLNLTGNQTPEFLSHTHLPQHTNCQPVAQSLVPKTIPNLPIHTHPRTPTARPPHPISFHCKSSANSKRSRRCRQRPSGEIECRLDVVQDALLPTGKR